MIVGEMFDRPACSAAGCWYNLQISAASSADISGPTRYGSFAPIRKRTGTANLS